MNKEILDKAKVILAERKILNNDINKLTIKRMLSNPEFSKYYYDNQNLIAEYASTRFRGDDPSAIGITIETNKRRLSAIATEYSEDINYSSCSNCQDSGYDMKGNYCDCLISEYRNIIRQTAFTEGDMLHFEFKDNYTDANTSQHAFLNKLYASIGQYADNFPNNQKKHILILGKTGVGKSCLLSALGNKLIDKFAYVIYLNAFKLNNKLLKHHIGELNDNDEFMNSLINCDALFIDDLGSEPIYNNVTLNYLYVIMEQRRDKYLFISTNLSNEELLNRYGDRIFSRLIIKESTVITTIDGDNLRQL